MQPTNEQKRAALEAALRSDAFARSEQLRAFLRFVCEREMAGEASELTEYSIGTKALGRPEGFSPLEDSSVRTRAYELRQRLQKYYAAESPGDAVRIEIPKGSYAPRFTVIQPVAPVAPERPLPAPARGVGWLAPFAAGLLLAGSIAAGLFLYTRAPAIDPAIRNAWASLAAKDSETIVSMGTPLHLLVTPYLGVIPRDSAHYAAPQELYPLFSRYRNLPSDARLEMQPVQKAVPMGGVESLARVLGVLQSMRAQARILPESDSPLTALRRRSVVLIASPWYSRSAEVLLENTPWTTRWDEATRQIGLFGQGARSGKRYVPTRGSQGEYQEVFGLITVLPNDATADGARSIAVFSGLTSAGTFGAASYFTSAADLAGLGERFRKEGLTSWPKSYQVVVRCRASNDAQLLSYAYETHEILMK